MIMHAIPMVVGLPSSDLTSWVSMTCVATAMSGVPTFMGIIRQGLK